MNDDLNQFLTEQGIDSGLCTLAAREPGEVITHDYTRRYFGHDYTFTVVEGGQRGEMTGWGYGIVKGDYLILRNKTAGSRYQVDEISYYNDPPDMWRAKVTFAPRTRRAPAVP